MQSSWPGWSDTTNGEVRAAQLAQCYGQLPISLAVNLINGAILTAVLWGEVGRTPLLAWGALLVAVTAARYRAMRQFRRASAAGRADHHVWTRNFVAGACAAGVAWGAAAVLLFHPASFPYQVLLAFVLGGMVAGAIPLLSAVDHAYHCFAIPVVVPITLEMVLVGDRVHLVMALLTVIFGAAMLASATQVQRLFRDAERLRQALLLSRETGQILEHLVRVDALTGIANRRHFEEALQREWRRALRENNTLSLISADIDHFKEYNDHYGHPAGDRCLVKVAQTLKSALSRPGDVVARIGGEEFAVLLPGTPLAGAVSMAELMRERILQLHLPHDASPVVPQVTVSFGVASSELAGVTSPQALLRDSDLALYDAKREGRNRVAVRRANDPS